MNVFNSTDELIGKEEYSLEGKSPRTKVEQIF